MQSRFMNKKMSGWKGRYVLLVLFVLIVGYVFFFTWKIQPPKTVTVAKGNTIQKFFAPLSWKQQLRMKTYVATHKLDLSKLEVGTYEFSGSYLPGTYMETIQAGPTTTYIRYTILEWWSVYDIDADMANKGLISSWEFLAYANSQETIKTLVGKFPFLQQEKELKTLEWFLYPDTYFLWKEWNTIEQLVNASLKRFDEKIISLWTAYKEDFTKRLDSYTISLTLPWAITLASIIQKEERVDAEKPTIAWIFLNRLSEWIQLGADISLCYGREQPYESCTPSLISQYVYDATNPYNTRMQKWLPPTPISSITSETFDALLHFKNTPYLFYLHDANWNIHYAKTNAEHEENKSQYLQ